MADPPDPATTRPTIEAVARRAGVSRQTVSNALNAPDRLRPDTLAAVNAAIDFLGYRPNEAARSLRSRTSRLIGLRVSPARIAGSGAVLDRFLHALCDSAGDRGYAVLAFAASSDDEEISAYEDLLRRNAVDAFALAETRHGDQRARWLLQHGAAFVAFGRPWGQARSAHSWVDVDGAAGVAAAVGHLVQNRHRSIAFLGWPAGSGSGDDRLAGWRSAVAEYRLPQRGLTAHVEDGLVDGQAAAGRLLDRRHPPTAFVCASDVLALGALRAVTERGLKPGVDIGVIGFDDSPSAALITPGLTSVRQPLEAVASTLVELVVENLRGERVRPRHVLLPPSLTIRASSEREPS